MDDCGFPLLTSAMAKPFALELAEQSGNGDCYNAEYFNAESDISGGHSANSTSNTNRRKQTGKEPGPSSCDCPCSQWHSQHHLQLQAQFREEIDNDDDIVSDICNYRNQMFWHRTHVLHQL